MIVFVQKNKRHQILPETYKLDIDERERPNCDLYQVVAYKYGWDGDGDALWYLSTKGIIRVIKKG